MKKTIFINGRFMTQVSTGVQRYAIELFKSIDRHVDEEPERFHNLKLVCMVPKGKYLRPEWKNIEVRQVGLFRGNLWEQFELPLYLSGDLLFSPGNIGPWFYGNQIVTLHDASVFAVPEAYSLGFRMKYNFVFRQVARKARAIVTDSLFSQTELARYLDTPREKFSVIYPGGDHLSSVDSDISVLKRQRLSPGDYFLIVSSQSLHKNIDRVLRAFEKIDFLNRLVIVGVRNTTIFRKATDIGGKEAAFLGYVSDPELKALYENATALIHPSLYEGFGFPVLEAMSCGCPVLCANSASLPEIAGKAALYFDPLDADSVVKAITLFENDPRLRVRLRKRGFQQSKKYTWEATAIHVLEKLSGNL